MPCHCQLFSDIAAEILIGRQILCCRFIALRVQRVAEDYAAKVICDLLLRFARKLHHIRHIYLCLFRERKSVGFRCGVYRQHRDLLLDGSLREHIRFANKVALVIQHFQGGKQAVGAVIAECGVVCSGVDKPVFLAELIVEAVQSGLLLLNGFIGIVFRLILDERSYAISNSDHCLDTVFRSHRDFDGIHTAVFAVVNPTVIECIAEIAYIRVCGNRTVFFLRLHVVDLVFGDLRMDVLNCCGKLLAQLLILVSNTGRFISIRAADHFHLAEDHVRIIYKVAVHGNAVGIPVQMNPIRLNVQKSVSFLKENDIRRHFRSGSTLEGVIRQTDSADKVSPLGDILSHGGIFLIQGSFRCDERYDAARSNLIQSAGKEIIMDEEIMLVIAFIRHLELPKRDIANGSIEEAVRKIGLFKTLHRNGVALIKLLCDTPGNAVQLHTVELGGAHAVRDKPHEIADAARRLQHISRLKAHVVHSVVNRLNDNRRRVECRQRRLSCRSIFILGENGSQFIIMGIVFLKELSQAAPSDIIRQNSLFIRISQTMLVLQLVQ